MQTYNTHASVALSARSAALWPLALKKHLLAFAGSIPCWVGGIAEGGMEWFEQVQGKDLPAESSCYRAAASNAGFRSSRRYTGMWSFHTSRVQTWISGAGVGWLGLSCRCFSTPSAPHPQKSCLPLCCSWLTSPQPQYWSRRVSLCLYFNAGRSRMPWQDQINAEGGSTAVRSRIHFHFHIGRH